MFADFVLPFLFGLYVAVTMAQLALWWGVFAQLASAPTPLRLERGGAVSVVICARNEAGNLRCYLPRILAQQYAAPWEVIVVDDASDDDTAAILRVFQESNPDLRVIKILEKQHPGKKHALAQGIAAARYNDLLLTDADCEPASPHWLAHIAAALNEKPETEIALGYGPLHSNSGEWGLNGWSRFEAAHTAIQYCSFALAGMPYMGVGRNLAVKKQVYERVGGFASHWDMLSGDDDLLVNTASAPQNVAICLHPESFMFSESKKTWREWMRQKRRHLQAGKRYRLLHRTLLALLSLSQVLHYFLLIVLLAAGFGTAGVVALFIVRSGSVWFLCGKIFPKLLESRLIARVPLFDALMAVYYGVFVPFVLIAGRPARSWK